MWKNINELPEDILEEIPLVIITKHNWIHGAYYKKYYSSEKSFDLEDCGGEWVSKENVKYWCYKEDFLESIQKDLYLTKSLKEGDIIPPGWRKGRVI